MKETTIDNTSLRWICYSLWNGREWTKCDNNGRKTSLFFGLRFISRIKHVGQSDVKKRDSAFGAVSVLLE